MTKTNLSTVLALIPRSDEQMAHDIGISSKTIYRIKQWDHKPSKRIEAMITNYLIKFHHLIMYLITDLK